MRKHYRREKKRYNVETFLLLSIYETSNMRDKMMFTLIEEYAYEEQRHKQKINSGKLEKLISACIKETNNIHRFEFISEHSQSDQIPLLLANIMDKCRKEEREKLAMPVRELIETMIAGAMEVGRSGIEEALQKERNYLNSQWNEEGRG